MFPENLCVGSREIQTLPTGYFEHAMKGIRMLQRQLSQNYKVFVLCRRMLAERRLGHEFEQRPLMRRTAGGDHVDGDGRPADPSRPR